jgi:plasmid stability protein
MAALYVENVPDDLYEALRKRTRGQRRCIAAEVIQLLELNIPTEKVLSSRRKALAELAKLPSSRTPSPGPFPSSEEMIREDRKR